MGTGRLLGFGGEMYGKGNLRGASEIRFCISLMQPSLYREAETQDVVEASFFAIARAFPESTYASS